MCRTTTNELLEVITVFDFVLFICQFSTASLEFYVPFSGRTFDMAIVWALLVISLKVKILETSFFRQPIFLIWFGLRLVFKGQEIWSELCHHPIHTKSDRLPCCVFYLPDLLDIFLLIIRPLSVTNRAYLSFANKSYDHFSG